MLEPPVISSNGHKPRKRSNILLWPFLLMSAMLLAVIAYVVVKPTPKLVFEAKPEQIVHTGRAGSATYTLALSQDTAMGPLAKVQASDGATAHRRWRGEVRGPGSFSQTQAGGGWILLGDAEPRAATVRVVAALGGGTVEASIIRAYPATYWIAILPEQFSIKEVVALDPWGAELPGTYECDPNTGLDGLALPCGGVGRVVR